MCDIICCLRLYLQGTHLDMSAIIPPGPELEPKIHVLAAKLSKLTKSNADDTMKKLLNSARAHEVFFIDPTDMFYPYFLQQLTNYRNDSKKAQDLLTSAQQKKDTAAPATGTPSSTETVVPNTLTTSTTGAVVRSGGTVNEELLRSIEQEAKLHVGGDPHPDVFIINRDHHPVEIVPRVFGYMSVTAQYSAKFGPSFLDSVRRKYGEEDVFRFLRHDDHRHLVFRELELAYQTILCTSDADVEDRLDLYKSKESVLKLCEEKSRFVRAEIARKKAALLTDDELRRRLEWDAFNVVQAFTAKDLGLEIKAAVVANQTPAVSGRYLAPPNAATQTFMNNAFVKPSDQPKSGGAEDSAATTTRFLQPPSTGPRFLQPPTSTAPHSTDSSIQISDTYELRTAETRPTSTMEYFVDPTTGQRLHVSELQGHSAAVVRDARLGEGKRPRDDDASSAYAGDEEYERNILRRVGGQL